MTTSIQDMERMVMEQTVRDLLSAGYTLSVRVGGEDVDEITGSTDHEAIVKAMRAGDEDWLVAEHLGTGNGGWVRFIYGESGWDVINDYTVNLESALAGTLALTDRLMTESDPAMAQLGLTSKDHPLQQLASILGDNGAVFVGKPETGTWQPVTANASAENERHEKLRKRAEERWSGDEIQIDADAQISEADDGAWVEAWVWVAYSDIEEAGDDAA